MVTNYSGMRTPAPKKAESEKRLEPVIEEKNEEPIAESAPKNQVTNRISYPTLRRGAQGDLVCQLQDFLSRAGSTVKINGMFNGGTENAVKAFQKRHGLKSTGVVDDRTWSELLKIK